MNLPARFVRGIVVVGVAAGLALSNAPAAGALSPPPNDSLANATTLTLEPHTVRQNTTLATYDPTTDDGLACTYGASVWYKMRPAVDRKVRLSTVGSSYDTVLGVYAGPRSSLANIACNDDAVVFQSAVQVDLTAGTTYFVSISACCSPGAQGGPTVLNVVSSGPLTASMALSEVTTGSASGRAYVSGTRKCSRPAAMWIGATLSQRLGQQVARGSREIFVPFCRWDAPFVVPVDSETALAFQSGPAVVTLTAAARDGFSGISLPTIEKVVEITVVAGKVAAITSLPQQLSGGPKH